jgi:hypothetical protein
VVRNFLTKKESGMEFYKDKQSGEILTEEEMLDMVDGDDELDSFYLIGDFKTREKAEEYLKRLT